MNLLFIFYEQKVHMSMFLNNTCTIIKPSKFGYL